MTNADPEKQPAQREDTVAAVSKTIIKHSHDGDEALKAFIGREGEVIEIDEATNRRLLRIIDWNLIPISMLTATEALFTRRIVLTSK